MPTISMLPGLWTRSFKSWSDGRCDSTTNVSWLQGVTLYGDLRHPPDVPDFSHARGLDSLTLADCSWLATQEGFAGVFRSSGDNFEWARLIDLHPPRPELDIGRLYWQGEILIEEGLRGEYIEHWNRTPNLPASPCAGVALTQAGTGRWGCLLRAADTFIYARDRAVQISGDSLASAIAAAPDLRVAQSLFDFEISLGQVMEHDWRITRSTLPFRVGDRLNPAITATETATFHDRDNAGRATLREWDITHTEGDVSFLST